MLDVFSSFFWVCDFSSKFQESWGGLILKIWFCFPILLLSNCQGLKKKWLFLIGWLWWLYQLFVLKINSLTVLYYVVSTFMFIWVGIDRGKQFSSLLDLIHNDQNLVGIKKQRNLIAKVLYLILVNSQTYDKKMIKNCSSYMGS